MLQSPQPATEGSYLLQASMTGHTTCYQSVAAPVPGENLGVLILPIRDIEMDEVVVKAERIPVQIKKDTVEYDAGAFKTRPDASVEELLQQLPGLEVDRAGNIKAHGEQVNKLYVDGKEFFGNAPTVATRNISADAIRKVQVFDKKSDRASFTGVDDGVREPAINLTLNENKKQGYFGDLTAGAGTEDRYKGSGRLYRFRPQSQFAALGMYNNINRSGFSFGDYLNFSGGLRNLMNGGNRLLEIANAENMAIDFGMPVSGKIRNLL